MYGPIIPVIKAKGTKASTIVIVDMTKGVLISNMAATILSLSEKPFLVNASSLIKREMLSTPVMGSSTNKPKERIKANKVTLLMV